MKNAAAPQPPQYRLRRARPRVSRAGSAKRAEWLGAAVGVLFMVGIIGGLAWVVVSGVGTSRWVLQYGTPTPKPSLLPAAATAATPLPNRLSNQTGTISGRVGYPASTAPAQNICAESASNSGVSFCTQHEAGNFLTYSFDVPVGTYYVYATLVAPQGSFSTSYRAYFNQYVQCTAGASCASSLHSKYLPVTVTAGAEISDINPTDWYVAGASSQ